MESSNKEKQWGGARKGAGRKKTGAKYYGFTSTPEVMAILEAVEGNKSRYINQAIIAYAASLGER